MIQSRSSAVSLHLSTFVVLFLTIVLYLYPVITWLISLSIRSTHTAASFEIFITLAPYTIGISIASALLATMMGFLVSMLFVFSSQRFRVVILLLISTPLVVGFMARNFSWIGILSMDTRLNDILYTKAGVLLVLSTVFAPFAFFLTVPGISWLRPIHFEACRTLGVSHAGTLRALVLPAAWRSILLAVVLTFVLANGYFVTPRMIGGGKHDFIGNGIITLMDYGLTISASRLALYLLLTTSVPIGVVLYLSARRRSLILGHR